MVYTDQGFVIKKNDLLSDDKIIQLFLKEHGKISAVAKGIKKILSKKSGNLELLNKCKFSIAKGKNLDIITEVSLIDSYQKIREDQSLIFLLFFFDEVINKMVYDGEISEDIYSLLSDTLDFLEEGNILKIRKIAGYFNSRVLLYSGLSPELYDCIKCSKPLEEDDEKVYTRSGVAHSSCLKGKSISNTEIKVLRYVMKYNLSEYAKISTSEMVENIIFSLTMDIIEYTIGSSIRSKIYIK